MIIENEKTGGSTAHEDEKLAKKKFYHHGDLKAALLEAAEKVLAEKGTQGFTLRACARYAGVSHAAPAHHYKDVAGLLTALATQAFERLHTYMYESMQQLNSQASADEPCPTLAKSICGSGLGYLRFAVNHPHHFRLMFQRESLNCSDGTFLASAKKAFNVLKSAVAEFHQLDSGTMPAEAENDLLILWSMVQGLADLYLEKQLPIDSLEALETHYLCMCRRLMSGGLQASS